MLLARTPGCRSCQGRSLSEMISDNGVLVVMARMLLPGRPSAMAFAEGPGWRYCRARRRGEDHHDDGSEGGSINGLVDVDRGIISREIFVNEEIYRQEQEQVFARAWLFVGHESQIPKPGDFFVSSMGEESVILCRDRAGRIHVFLNSCRHRGMKVCRYDEGNTVEFMCPYHGWSYGTDGALVGVPFAQGRLRRAARSQPVGADRGRPAGELQGRDLGDVGRRPRRRSSNTSAATSSTSICCSTPGTGARAAPR